MKENSYIKISPDELKDRIKDLPKKIKEVCLENTYRSLVDSYNDYKNSLIFAVKNLFGNNKEYTFDDYFQEVIEERKTEVFSTYWKCWDSHDYREIIRTLFLLSNNTQGDVYLSSEHLTELVRAENKSKEPLITRVPESVREYFYRGDK